MDTRIIKIAIAALSLWYTVQLFVKGSIGSGIGMALVTAVLILVIFRSVRLIWAFWQMRNQKFDKANRILNKINPDKLFKKQGAYYNFLKGTVELQLGNITPSENFFKKALAQGLRMTHDKAAAKLNLAMIAMSKQRKKEALLLIVEAKRLDKKGMLAKDIKMVEKAMKQPQKVIRQRR
jgi:tetratricopeptide (TPR) repeat protein